jgi:hypothetical protein
MYLIFFMILMGLKNSKTQIYKIFYVITLYSGCIILGLYLYQVLYVYFSKDVESLIGLTHAKDNLIYLYKEHVLIFFTYLVCYKKTNENLLDDKVKEFNLGSLKDRANAQEARDLSQTNTNNLDNVDKPKEQSIDNIKLFIVKHLVWIHYFAVVVVIFLPPLNFFSFVYLNWLYLLIGVIIISPKMIYKSDWIRIVTSIFSVYSAVILLLRYTSQISSKYLKSYLNSTSHLDEDDFGLSETYSTYILFGNSVLFLLFSFHRKIIQEGTLPQILEKIDIKIKSRIPIPKTLDYYRYSLIVWYMQAKFLLNPLILITIVFIASMLLQNLIGLIYLILLIIGIVREYNRA